MYRTYRTTYRTTYKTYRTTFRTYRTTHRTTHTTYRQAYLGTGKELATKDAQIARGVERVHPSARKSPVSQSVSQSAVSNSSQT